MKSTLLFFSLFLSINLSAQSLKGVIYDTDGEPVIGAYVNISNQNEHSHSNEFGEFFLENVTLGDSLHISHLLYEGKSLVVKDFSDLSIKLTEQQFLLENVVIQPSIVTTKHVTDIDTKLNPVNNSQQLLSKVPGLFIGQHAGGGKAEQIFLRGFDIDHGTDISIAVDGMPVNMVSHAHGQGYADLHFLIPETVERVGFDKGPYFANKGNFNTAGFVDFSTKSKLKGNLVSAQYGQFNNMRIVTLLDLVSKEKTNAYIATEYNATDGYFDSPQNFERINLFGKYSTSLSDGEYLSVTASFFDSEWTASGQIPERAVESGLIGRFGAIDDTEGGKTGRSNILLDYSRQLNHNLLIKNKFYYSRYNFELFSNFTFFAGDPVNGDQIKQKEVRDLFGLNSDIEYQLNSSMTLKGGVGLRKDRSQDNQLAHTLNRKTILENYRIGDIDETNASTYASLEWNVGNLLISPGIRGDLFLFNYEDEITPDFTEYSTSSTLFTPKLILAYQLNEDIQLFGKVGQGFHSNDTRVVLENESSSLPKGTGVDLGLNWKVLPNLIVNTALWQLHLEQEFVYVGDEGIVEPSGETIRRGIDLGLRYQMLDWVFASVDMNYTKARSLDAEEGSDYIPLAPVYTLQSNISFDHKSGFFGSLSTRYMGDRAATEDYSITAEGYMVWDAIMGYTIGNVSFSAEVQNLLNTEWNETQFATTSRLFDEPTEIEEIHFTPGTPFNLSGKIVCRF